MMARGGGHGMRGHGGAGMHGHGGLGHGGMGGHGGIGHGGLMHGPVASHLMANHQANYVPKIHHHDYYNQGPAGPQTPTVAYPYYTTRAPRDFLMANPPSIGP